MAQPSSVPQKLDDRPVAGDTGMADSPVAPMSKLGQQLRQNLLDPQHYAYHASENNQALTIDSLNDFLNFWRVLGKGPVELHSPDGREAYAWLGAGDDRIKIRLAGDGVRFLFESGYFTTTERPDGWRIRLDPTRSVPPEVIHAFLIEGMPEAESKDETGSDLE